MIKDVKGFEGVYFVDDSGKVFSKRRQGNKGGEIAPVKSTGGYFRVYLRNKGPRKTVLLHRVVAEAFIPNPENKPCVNHKNGDKSDNSVENLEWVTYSENMKHAVKNGLNAIPGLCGEKHPNSKLSWKSVSDIRRCFSDGESPRTLAKKYGITREQVYNIVNFKQWTHISDIDIGGDAE